MACSPSKIGVPGMTRLSALWLVELTALAPLRMALTCEAACTGLTKANIRSWRKRYTENARGLQAAFAGRQQHQRRADSAIDLACTGKGQHRRDASQVVIDQPLEHGPAVA